MRRGDGRNSYIRSPPNNNPVKDLSSSAMACNVNNRAVSKTLSVKAGDKYTCEWYHDSRSDDIIASSHKGPGKLVETFLSPILIYFLSCRLHCSNIKQRVSCVWLFNESKLLCLVSVLAMSGLSFTKTKAVAHGPPIKSFQRKACTLSPFPIYLLEITCLEVCLLLDASYYC
jgi:hypothetical protein